MRWRAGEPGPCGRAECGRVRGARCAACIAWAEQHPPRPPRRGGGEGSGQGARVEGA
eukprot:gene6993-6933_t